MIEITDNDVNKHYHHSHEFVGYFVVILSWKAICLTIVAYMIAMVTYNKASKEKVFRLPRDPAERERWIKMIPRDNIPDNPNTVICERHFPSGYETITVFVRKRLHHPPSIFDCVKPSLMPSTPAPPRPTSQACSTSRNIIEDEMKEFLEMDKIKSFNYLCERVIQKNNISFNNTEIVSYLTT